MANDAGEILRSGPRSVRPAVAILLVDVAYLHRKLERYVGHDLPLTPCLAFYELHRAESRRRERGIPSEPDAVHDALRELVPTGEH